MATGLQHCRQPATDRLWPASAALAGVLVALLPSSAEGHGYLFEPPSRNYLKGRAGQDSCSHCLQGGGPSNVQARSRGVWPTNEDPESHGLCGDPAQHQAWKPHAEQRYIKSGPAKRTYTAGSVVTFRVGLTVHHKGHYEFRLCDRGLDTFPTAAPAQDCLEKYVLERAPVMADCVPDDARADCQPVHEQQKHRWYLPPPGQGVPKAEQNWEDSQAGSLVRDVHEMRFKIPDGLNCTHCTLQWWWPTANSCLFDWGYVEYFREMQRLGWSASKWSSASVANWVSQADLCKTGGMFGEEFWNCADVEVLAKSQEAAPEPTPTQGPAPVQAPEPKPAPPAPEPSLEPMPEPTPEPTPVQAPEPKPAPPAPEPSQEPAPEPTPEPTPVQAPEPAPPAPEPSQEPAPEPTPVQAPEPKPAPPAPEPSQEPAAEPSQEPAPEPMPVQAPEPKPAPPAPEQSQEPAPEPTPVQAPEPAPVEAPEPKPAPPATEPTPTPEPAPKCFDLRLKGAWGAFECKQFTKRWCGHKVLKEACCFCDGGSKEPVVPTPAPRCTDLSLRDLPEAKGTGWVNFNCGLLTKVSCGHSPVRKACCICGGGSQDMALAASAVNVEAHPFAGIQLSEVPRLRGAARKRGLRGAVLFQTRQLESTCEADEYEGEEEEVVMEL